MTNKSTTPLYNSLMHWAAAFNDGTLSDEFSDKLAAILEEAALRELCNKSDDLSGESYYCVVETVAEFNSYTYHGYAQSEAEALAMCQSGDFGNGEVECGIGYPPNSKASYEVYKVANKERGTDENT